MDPACPPHAAPRPRSPAPPCGGAPPPPPPPRRPPRRAALDRHNWDTRGQSFKRQANVVVPGNRLRFALVRQEDIGVIENSLQASVPAPARIPVGVERGNCIRSSCPREERGQAGLERMLEKI